MSLENQIPMFQVDAFAERPFVGNPAAVCFPSGTVSSEWMQNVAMEMNLSETAFIQHEEGTPHGAFRLRWFTPAAEVDLCGHATLAAAHVVWERGVVPAEQQLTFSTRSGILTCQKRDGMIELDFPAVEASPVKPNPKLLQVLGIDEVTYVGENQFDQLIVVGSEDVVRQLHPDFAKLREFKTRGVMVSSVCADSRYDFVSRYFAPAFGIDEDPVTGSAHCCLAPYWSKQLKKQEMTAFQASPRGGEVRMCIQDDRVLLRGNAVTVLRGTLDCCE